MQGGRVLAALLLSAIAGGCAADPYPLPASPPNAAATSVVAVGEPTHGVVLLYVQIRPGDSIEFIRAEPVGMLEGALTRMVLSRHVAQADGTFLIGSTWEPLEGASVTATEAAADWERVVAVGAELTATRAGRFSVDDIRLTYRLNGGGQRTGQGIDITWTVCADDHVPAECGELDAE